MVATQAPAPAHLPEMAHFDYALGHIAAIADLSYEAFLAYDSHPSVWEALLHHYVEVHRDLHDDQHFAGFAAADHFAGDPAGLYPADSHPDLLGEHHHPGGIDHHHTPGDDGQQDSADQPLDGQQPDNLT
jgi:hypothetical protein